VCAVRADTPVNQVDAGIWLTAPGDLAADPVVVLGQDSELADQVASYSREPEHVATALPPRRRHRSSVNIRLAVKILIFRLVPSGLRWSAQDMARASR
jgi:hypothetical protein